MNITCNCILEGYIITKRVFQHKKYYDIINNIRWPNFPSTLYETEMCCVRWKFSSKGLWKFQSSKGSHMIVSPINWAKQIYTWKQTHFSGKRRKLNWLEYPVWSIFPGETYYLYSEMKTNIFLSRSIYILAG